MNNERILPKRLTIADEKHSDGTMVFHKVGYITSDMAYELYWALKKYEDTGYGPEVFERLNGPETPLEIEAMRENSRLRQEKDAEKKRADDAERKIYEIAHDGLCAACEQSNDVCNGHNTSTGCPFVNLFVCGGVCGAVDPDDPCTDDYATEVGKCEKSENH